MLRSFRVLLYAQDRVTLKGQNPDMAPAARKAVARASKSLRVIFSITPKVGVVFWKLVNEMNGVFRIAYI